MKKILIVSLWGNQNYGNKLQSYALHKLIKDLGYWTVTLEVIQTISCKKKIKRLLANLGVYRFRDYRYSKIRANEFDDFTKGYVNDEIIIESFEDIYKKDLTNISKVVVGSDQVWHNWSNTYEELEFYYLKFVPSKKRIAFAASFGFEAFPSCDKKGHESGIRGMNSISCREESGKKLVQSVTGCSTPVILDPTLCVSKTEWSQMEKRPLFHIHNKYMLIYFLGDIRNDYKKEIVNISKEFGLHMINLQDYKEKHYYKASPAEFLWLFHNAEYVCTDSFHATAFSLIYHKRFSVFYRNGSANMFDRIQTLLNKMEVKGRAFNMKDYDKMGQIDFFQVDNILKSETIKAKEYLERALSSD